MLARTWLLLSLLGLALVGAAQAQQATIKRTVLQRSDVPGSTYEVVLGLAELRAAGLIGKHTHPGTEQGSLVEGELTLMVQGQPDAVFKPGQSWMIPAGTPHWYEVEGQEVFEFICVVPNQPDRMEMLPDRPR